jgi:hypothetical protein
MKSNVSRLVLQISVSILIGLVFGWVISETSFQSLREGVDRPAKTIEIVIPAGTAEQIGAGKSVNAIPENLVIAEGDTLLVKNQDSVSHQLGPTWIPANSSSSLLLNRVDRYIYACSFQSSQFVGLTVQPRTTLSVRITGILLAGLPTGVMVALYSLIIFPLKPKNQAQTQTTG